MSQVFLLFNKLGPLTRWLGVEPDRQLSPALAVKVIHAASASTASFEEASANLRALAEAEVSPKRISRLVTRIGNERIAQVEQQARALETLSLPDQQQSPVDVTPDLVCLQCDGGRLQIRDRTAPVNDSVDAASTYWRESKVGALIKMSGEVYDQDPCPKIPPIFVDPQRISRLTEKSRGFLEIRVKQPKRPLRPPRLTLADLLSPTNFMPRLEPSR